MSRGALLSLLLLLLLAACHPAAGTNAGLQQPEGWADDVALPAAADLSPDPNVVEVKLEARVVDLAPPLAKGMWAYEGSVPGPLIRSKPGDTVVVHFKNSLPEASTIHWHGIEVPSDMDGTEAAQLPVPPGGTFDYRFTTNKPGLYWYHPHVDSSAQVGFGLYGAFVVADEPKWGDEVVLVLSDVSIEDGGTLSPGDSSGWFGDYFGREGDTLLVNGRVQPTLKARAGVPQRWKLVNASRARYYELLLGPLDAVRIGGDDGLISAPQPGQPVLLTPGERAELWVMASQPGIRVPISWVDSDRFHIGTGEPQRTVLWVEVSSEPKVEGAPVPSGPLATLERLDAGDGDAGFRRIELMEGLDGGHLGINGKAFDPLEPLFTVKLGATERWEVINSTGYDHNFHLHGYAFQPNDVDGRPWPTLEWKDSVNVPAHAHLHLTARFADRPGMWMLHCHILDHAELGMMAMFHVEP